MLRLLGDGLERMFPLTRKAAYENAHNFNYKDLEDYFPSELGRTADRLKRRGLVDVVVEDGQMVVRIKEKGKTELLKYDLVDLKPKEGRWDGQWRIVFFDIPEKDRSKRDGLRDYLQKLGMEKMQESVYVSPYNVSDEIRYLREILEIPNGVKLGILKWIENEEELKEIFGIK